MLPSQNRILAAGLVVIIALLLTGFSEKNYTLRYAPKKDTVLKYKSTTETEQTMEMMGQESTTEVNAEAVMSVLVENVEDDGTIAYVVKIDSMIARLSSPMMGDTTLTAPEWVVGKRKRHFTSPLGKTLKTEQIDSVSAGGRLASMLSSVENSFTLPTLPEKAIAVGESWSDVVQDTIVREGGQIISMRSVDAVLTGIVDTLGHTCARVSFTGDAEVSGNFQQQGMKIGFEGEGPLDGTFYFDFKKGILVTLVTEFELDATIGMTGQMSMTIPQTTITKSTIVLVE